MRGDSEHHQSALPTGWAWVTLGELLREPLRNGKSAQVSGDGTGIRTLTLTAVTRSLFSVENTKVTVATAVEAEGLWLEPGDILIERSNTPELVGTTAMYRGQRNWAIFPDLLIRARLHELALAPYIESWMRSPLVRTYFRSRARGIAGSMPKISQETVSAAAIPLAPMPEQRRIVGELEKQFTRLDAVVAALEVVQAKLKRALASVLKAAVDGRLVPTEAALAQSEGRSCEPASVLLERIFDERRRRWADGKKYKPAIEPDLNRLPTLPAAWSWATVDQLASRVTKGTTPTSIGHTFTEHGVRFVKVESLAAGSIAHDQCSYISEGTHDSMARSRLVASDVLISIAGTLGRVAVVRDIDVPANTNQALGIVRPVDSRVSPFLAHALASNIAAGQVARGGRGVGLQNLNLEQVASFVVPLPPLAEQCRIVAEVERRLSVLESLEHTVEQNLACCGRLRQSILKHAFMGKLVSQDPADEPASELLARIRSERVAEATA